MSQRSLKVAHLWLIVPNMLRAFCPDDAHSLVFIAYLVRQHYLWEACDVVVEF